MKVFNTKKFIKDLRKVYKSHRPLHRQMIADGWVIDQSMVFRYFKHGFKRLPVDFIIYCLPKIDKKFYDYVVKKQEKK